MVLNSDVIALICEELEYGTQRALKYNRTEDDIACRKSLLSLSLTSKEFLEPALDVLWRRVASVKPLLSVLPETTTSHESKEMVIIFYVHCLSLIVAYDHRCWQNPSLNCPERDFISIPHESAPSWIYHLIEIECLDAPMRLLSVFSSSLHDLTLTFKEPYDSNPWEERSPISDFEIPSVTELIVKRHLSLEKLCFLSSGRPSDFIGSSIFKPLGNLTRLRVLRFGIQVSLNDQDTKEIASSLPQIEFLQVEPSIGQLPTMESLAHFARLCPNLKTLWYPVQVNTLTSTRMNFTLSAHPLTNYCCTSKM
jgi:hypothetical protein